MGMLDFMADRPTLVDRQRERYAEPKVKPGESRLDVKTDRVKADKLAEAAWKKDVWARDKGKDRYTGKKVTATLTLAPNRGERHHLAGKADKRVRWDRRNGIRLALSTHQQVERNELRIVGTVFFHVDGHQYINADFPVRFERNT